MKDSKHPTTFCVSDFSKSLATVSSALESYLELSRSAAGKVVDLKTVGEWNQGLELGEFIERAGSYGNPALIEKFLRGYLDSTIRLNDPRFIGHQVARPHFASAIADLVNGLTNNGMAVYEMGPGPVAIEKFVVEWLIKFLPQPGWQAAGGFLTHGGSIANLTALLAARGAKDPGSWVNGVNQKHVFLVPETSHYCVKRTISILGYGEKSIRFLKTNHLGQIEVHSIDETYQKAIADGLEPIVITANAGSTPTGMFDDLFAIGQVAKKRDLWFHVDGAHGASALVSPRHRDLLRGLELADSIVWDQHKLMQTSALCTAVLFRDQEALQSIFQQNASYLSQTQDEDSPNLFRQTIECTKVPMGLKLYLCLLACGEHGLADFIDILFARTKEIQERIDLRSGFSCPHQPQSNILCFQYRPDEYDQFEIREKIVRTGQFYFTQTVLNDDKYLRFTVTNPETDFEIVGKLLDEIERTALKLASGYV